MGFKISSFGLIWKVRIKLSYPKVLVEPKVVGTEGSALLQIIPDDLHTSLCDIHLDSTVGFCTPILTNTCIRECLAIIKNDNEAFAHLKAFAAVIVSEQEPELCVDSKTVAKSCFNLQCEHVGEIVVTFKLILEPMGETRSGESLSISVELVDPKKASWKFLSSC